MKGKAWMAPASPAASPGMLSADAHVCRECGSDRVTPSMESLPESVPEEATLTPDLLLGTPADTERPFHTQRERRPGMWNLTLGLHRGDRILGGGVPSGGPGS